MLSLPRRARESWEVGAHFPGRTNGLQKYEEDGRSVVSWARAQALCLNHAASMLCPSCRRAASVVMMVQTPAEMCQLSVV